MPAPIPFASTQPAVHHSQAQAQAQAQVWAEWEVYARQSLVDAMKRRCMGYKELSRELEKLGIVESPGQLNRKVNRMKFSAAFYLACLKALDTAGSPPQQPGVSMPPNGE